MFNLDESIQSWRRQAGDAGIRNPEVLDELESHLRDDVEEQVRLGSNVQGAFEAAVQRMGQANRLKVEFEKTQELAGKEEIRWSRAIPIAVGLLSGIFYVGVSAYGVLKHDMPTWQRALGLSALAITILLGFAVHFLARRLLGTAERGTKTAVIFGVAAAMIGWLLSFMFILLPHWELEIAGLVVAILWALTPGGAVFGLGLALQNENQRQLSARD